MVKSYGNYFIFIYVMCCLFVFKQFYHMDCRQQRQDASDQVRITSTYDIMQQMYRDIQFLQSMRLMMQIIGMGLSSPLTFDRR
jgi:hypothetical protein